MLGCDVTDQLHHVYGLTNTSTTEQTNLTTLSEWAKHVDYLDASFKQLSTTRLLFECWR